MSHEFNRGTVFGAGLVASAVGAYYALQRIFASPAPTIVSNLVPSQELTDEKLKAGFFKIYDELSQTIKTDAQEKFEVNAKHAAYIERLMKYNCTGGKANRALYVQATLVKYRASLNQGITQEELTQARVVGWCIEWLQAFFLVADDIMDQSQMRRNQPCWYKVDDVKLCACNDFLILESHIYRLLKKYIGQDTNRYLQLVELFHEVTYQTEIGQLFDLRNQYLTDIKDKPQGTIDLSLYTIDEYKRIVKYKTSFYSFYLPLACGLIIAGVKDQKVFDETRTFCLLMGEYFQITDDYLDCYADPEVLGKVGRDIEEGKCSWLVVQALKKVSKEQLAILQESYGKDDAQHVKRIKALYNELELQKTFAEYDDAAVKEMNNFIDKSQLKKSNQHQIYTYALALIAKRQK